MNPDGFTYPSPATGYGRNARNGDVAGSIMRNFKFLGYPNGDSSMGLQPVQMADYYDPCQKRYSLIHLTVAAVWCAPCNAETTAMVAAKAQLDGQRVLILQALDDGPTQGTGATQGDLDRWVARYSPKFTEVLDPSLQNLGGFFNAAAVPWNCDIDPRTMEIVDAQTGWTGDVASEIRPAIQSLGIDSTGYAHAAPLYPVSVTCN
jgi:hypothetical protein